MRINLSINSFLLKGLLVIILLNLNGIVYLLTGINGVFSPVILVLSVILAFRAKVFGMDWILKLFGIFYFFYCFIGLASILVTVEVGNRTFQTIIDLLKTLLLLFSTYAILSKEIKNGKVDYIEFFGIYVIASVVLSYFFYSVGLTDNIKNYRVVSRLSGLFANPNELAAQSLFSLVFIQYLIKKHWSKSAKLFVLFICAIVSVLVLFLSFSRSIVLAFFVLAFINFLFFTRYTLKTVFGIVIGFFIIVFTISIFYESVDISLRKRIDSSMGILDGDINEENTGGRIGLAKAGFEIFSQSPFIGNGLGYMQHMEGFGGVHNAYLAILGNSGIIPFCILLVVLFVLVIKSFKYAKQYNDPILLYLLLTILINGLTKTGVFEFKINNLIFALIFAVLYTNYHWSRPLNSDSILKQ